MRSSRPKSSRTSSSPTDTSGPKKLLKGEHNAQLPPLGILTSPGATDRSTDLGAWPAPGPLLREKGILYHVTEAGKLKTVHGDTRPLLVKFSISNDFMQMGEYVLPTGGVVCRHSEAIAHPSECVLVGLDGVMTVYLTAKRETYQLGRYEGLYLPANTEYKLINYETHSARCLFAAEGGKF